MPYVHDTSNSSGSDRDFSGEQQDTTTSWNIVSDAEYAAAGFAGSNEKPLSEQLEPIAVIGMGCRLPGDVSSPAEFWDLMINQRTGRTARVPESRFNIDAHYHPNNERPGSFNVLGGYFLDSSLKEFDPGLFNISPIEAMWLDPQQRKLLEVVYESLESSGTPMEKISGTKTACFVGSFTADYQQMSFKEPDFRHSYAATGVDPGIISNRISHVFNLSGPSITVNTACSSSVYAMHNACNALRNGECEGAIVGGTNLVLTVDQHMNTAKLGVLSDTSECHTFDECADGYGRADAVGAVYLKRLKDALRDGDPIRGCLRSSAVNSNGKVSSVGITYPNREGQSEVIRHAYARGGNLDPKMTGYFEIHGTGTPVGDPIECNAVSIAMNQNRSSEEEPLNIGAVKTNIGHSEAASGLSAVIKACLTVEKGIIPPIYKLNKLNPAIAWDDWKIKPVTKAIPFPSHLPLKRVSINSFGYGGTNGHMIVEAVDSLVPGYRILTPKPKMRGGFARKRPHLLTFSAHDNVTLKRNIASLASTNKIFDLHDLAHTLGNHRSKLGHRGFAVANCDSVAALLKDSAAKVTFGEAKGAVRVAFLFTGQGSQWARMGAELMRYYPTFLNTIKRLDYVLGDLPDAPDWTIEDLLLEEAATSRVGEAEFSQPLCTAIQIALVDLLGKWNVTPSVTAGHSSGEIAAAYAAGIISASHALVAAFYRGKVVSKVNANGAMMAVGLGPDEVTRYMGECGNDVSVACHNSNALVTLSGDKDALEKIKTSLDADKVFARLVNTGGKAYHSPHMLSVSGEYENLMKMSAKYYNMDLPSRPRCPMVSSVTNRILGPEAVLNETYWSSNLTNPVLFTEAVETIGKTESIDVSVLVEIGPHSSFSGPVRQICAVNGFNRLSYVPTLVRQQSSADNLLSTAGQLYLKGYDLDMARVTAIEELYPNGKLKLRAGSILVDLPTYQWNYSKTLWAEPRHSIEHRAPKFARHDLLGALMPGGSKFEPMWRNMLRIRDVPWLNSHSLGREAVFPAAGYLSMALEAVSQIEELNGSDMKTIESFVLRDISIKKALVTPDTDDGIETLFSLRPSIYSEGEDKPTWWDFNVTSFNADDGSWKEHCTGSVRVNGRARGETGRTPPAFPQRASGKSWNQGLREVGFDYGPGFQDMDNVRFNGKTYEAAADTVVKQESGMMQGESRHVLHPGCVDSCLQLIIVSIYAGNLARMDCGAVPIQVDEIAIFPPREAQLTHGNAFAWTDARGYRSFHSGCQLLAEDGELLMDIDGMRTVAYEAARPQSTLEPLKSQPYMSSVWKQDAALVGYGKESVYGSLHDLVQLYAFKKTGLNVFCTSSVMAGDLAPLAQSAHLAVTIASTTDQAAKAEVPPGFQFLEVDGKHIDESLVGTFDVVVAELGALQLDLESFHALLKDDGVLLVAKSPELASQSMLSSGFANVQKVQVAATQFLVAPALAAVKEDASTTSESYLILYRDELTPLGQQIASTLSSRSQVRFQSLKTCEPLPDDHVIMVADLEGAILSSLTELELAGLQNLTQTCSTVTWLSAGGTINATLPEHAMCAGLGRSLTSENAQLNFVTIDLDVGSTTPTEAAELIGLCLDAQTSTTGVRETEYAIAGGQVYISRLAPVSSLNDVYGATADDAIMQTVGEEARVEGVVANNKVLWKLGPAEEASPVPPAHVEIKVLYTGLTREGVQVINGTDYPTTFSTELVGIVHRVAAGESTLQQGDAVVAFHAASMGRFQTVPVRMVQRVSASSREELLGLAGLPIAYGRAFYGLAYLAKVQANESVLILGPTGPAGLAAISICKALGASATVVVDREQDITVLTDALAFDKEHIILASPDKLRSRILHCTANRGPDVIFSCSSVPKPLARECWRNIAPQGRFVDFGRKDVLKRAALDIVPLHAGAQYLSFDFAEMLQSSPETMATILEGLIEMYNGGQIAVHPPTTVVKLEGVNAAAAKFEETFASGKTVVSYAGTNQLELLPARPVAHLDPNGTYLLVGCLGGLGRSLTSWMLAHGARRFAFLSRSGADAPSAARLVHDLEDAGAHVAICRGDVSNLGDVEAAVKSVPSAHPVRGVVHAAMVLRDGMFHGLSHEAWQTSIAPKVRGALNLHNALKQAPLDFFLVTSSTSGTLGTPGQTNYAAGNAFLDSFARWRLHQRLPATSIVLPMVLGVGVVAENPELESALKRKGIYGIDEDHLLQSFEAALVAQKSATPIDQLIIGLDPSILQKSVNAADTVDGFWLADARFGRLLYDVRRFAGSNGAGGGSADSIAIAVQAAPSPAEAVQIVVDHFSEKLARLLLIDPAVIQPDSTAIAAYGLDSMIGAELRNWIFKNYSLDMPFQQLLGPSMTVTKFAGIACSSMGVEIESSQG